MRYTNKLSLLLLAIWSFASTLGKKDRDLPHPHQGLLKPYKAGPFESLKLDSSDEKLLESGKPVMKQTQGGDLGGGAICVQDVSAPKEAVWSQILELDKYKGKVPKVAEAKNYQVQKNSDGTCTIKTKMVVSVLPGYSVSSAVHLDECVPSSFRQFLANLLPFHDLSSHSILLTMIIHSLLNVTP